MAERGLIIAIDGPAGAGKTTVASKVAQRLDYLLVSTGAMYRAVAWAAIDNNIALDDVEGVGRLARVLLIELKGTVDVMRVLVDGRDVTEEIATPAIGKATSVVSSISNVRRALVAQQQEMGKIGKVVMEGRDIGTQVFPQAEIKIYLDASLEVRAQRRFACDGIYGSAVKSLEQMKSEIKERDYRDKTRADSPLAQAKDATYIDSSVMTIDEVVERILEIVAARK